MNQDNAPGPVMEGTLLWEPSEELRSNSNIAKFMEWLGQTRDLKFETYDELLQWSVDDLEGFWGAIWDYFQIISHSPYSRVLTEARMPGAEWFPGAALNYAEHVLRRRDDHPAFISKSEIRPTSTLTYREVHDQVARMAAGLRAMGVRKGDRVAAYMPNIPETAIACLAATSIGAIWATCAPEFGIRSVVERLRQIAPKVLFAADGYRFSGKDYPRLEQAAEIQSQIPSVEHLVMVPYLYEQPSLEGLQNAMYWRDAERDATEIEFEPVGFDHPLWVLFTSGTTGLPKPIVHGHGGVILEHIKCQSLQFNLGSDDTLLWFSTTGWMMWNFDISGLMLGMTVVLYDGNPVYPDLRNLWDLAEETKSTYFGTSAPFIHACMKEGIRPGREYDLHRIKGVGSTAAPLSPEGFQWIYDNIGSDVHVGSFCGGTDVCTGFIGPVPLLPVHAGEIQAACLGSKVEAFDPGGNPVVDEVGELVLTEPLPSMPLFFWNDPDGERYRESYYDDFPGVWRHGDWVKKTERGTFVVYGRSDSTLNRSGVRMGTSEFYRVIEEMDEVQDSLVIDTGRPNEQGQLLLFLKLSDGVGLDEELQGRIRTMLRRLLSPRHSPDQIFAIPEVPKTLNDKKLEVPVKRIITGAVAGQVINRDAMSNPESLEFFVELGKKFRETAQDA